MKYRFLAALGLLPLLALHPAGTPPCRVQLLLSQQGQLLRVTGTCRSQLDQAAHYRYELRALRQGPGRPAHTSQRGSFELPAQQQVALAQLGLHIGTLRHYRLRLLVFDATGRAIAQDSATH
ncbi:hypothetical protein GCM10023172_28330 [Hymenobacter ginsengisoli]|uniref:Curli assembly protein CsgC n=1 Tax=Hymenobacter ginsengisoli TaxID=1051626 RepID=A0ABP8QHR4_9BACT|nr:MULTISPECIES: curli-like amyloid fiber formation chaperone CsgH [unclassified Hymenobacter]MBO2029912.1 hypothetical protein [Hymenobacter sp. BT559]